MFYEITYVFVLLNTREYIWKNVRIQTADPPLTLLWVVSQTYYFKSGLGLDFT